MAGLFEAADLAGLVFAGVAFAVGLLEGDLAGVAQVWSLTQLLYSVDFSQSKIGVKSVINKCTNKVCVS